jgi:hypothetical protein
MGEVPAAQTWVLSIVRKEITAVVLRVDLDGI